MSDTGSNDWCVESVVGDSYHLGSLGKIGIDGDGCDEEDVFLAPLSSIQMINHYQ